jgi:hypothetical protein
MQMILHIGRQFFLERLDLVIKDARKQRDEYEATRAKVTTASISQAGRNTHINGDDSY